MLEDSYEPLSIEQKWQSEWELKNQFKPVESDKQFSIVIPPPNVTGSLHMGHALLHNYLSKMNYLKKVFQKKMLVVRISFQKYGSGKKNQVKTYQGK